MIDIPSKTQDTETGAIHGALSPSDKDRQAWLSVLAKTSSQDVEAIWESLSDKPEWTLVRPPETGMVMVRARAGGDGGQFNFGEMTMTRAAVRLTNGATGFGFVQGRARRHAELVAVFDAMLQMPGYRETIEQRVLTPLADGQAAARELRSRKAANTKVEFFTMVRGDG